MVPGVPAGVTSLGVPAQRRSRFEASSGRALAITVAVGIHAAIGAYLLSATFRPLDFGPPAVATPTIDAREIVLEPPKAAPPRPTGRALAARPAERVPDLVRPVPIQVAPSPQPERTTPTIFAQNPGEASLQNFVDPPILSTTISDPEWVSRPNAAQVAAAYPQVALRQGVSGAVTLACRVTVSGGAASCDVISESPEGYDFGEAAIGLSRYFRMKPRTENGVPVDGASVRIPIRFTVASP